MQATRVIRTIQDTQLRELASYIGQQVEIIIWPVAGETSTSASADFEAGKTRFFEMIDQHAGSVSSWTREELHER